jgi:hypothetical protein
MTVEEFFREKDVRDERLELASGDYIIIFVCEGNT